MPTVINENPYRAAGTFDGVSYIEREADNELYKEILKNSRYLYFLAPRQSGKSSLISHIQNKLDENIFKNVCIDLTTFPVKALKSGNAFNKHIVNLIVSAFDFQEELENKRDLKKVLEKVVKKENKRILIFVDEIDRILHTNFKDSWFGLIRSFFNSRASEPGLEFSKLQFIFSGAATVTSLISNKNMSPFNIGKEIELDDFTFQQTSEIAKHLEKGDREVVEGVAKKIYDLTSGTPYLTQLILERLWENAIDGKTKKITEEDAEEIADNLIIEAPTNIHFITIYESIANEPTINKIFINAIEGRAGNKSDMDCLKITGILNKKNSYRNRIYERVFGENGPLSLFMQKKILIFSSNPKATVRIRFDEEVREIKEGLSRSRYKDQFEIEIILAGRLQDLRKELFKFNPQIVHFICLAQKEGLLMEDEYGMATPISPKTLSGLFSLLSDTVKCVVLVSNNTIHSASAISKHIDYVIGTKIEIRDNAAIEFSVGFYDALGAGKSVEEAYEFGCNAILQMYPDLPSHSLLPILIRRKGLKKQSKETKFKSPIKKDIIIKHE